MIELLQKITHVNGFLIEPSEIVSAEDVRDGRIPRERSIVVDDNEIRIYAETETLAFLCSAVKDVLADKYRISEVASDVAGFGTLNFAQLNTKQKHIAGDDDGTVN